MTPIDDTLRDTPTVRSTYPTLPDPTQGRDDVPLMGAPLTPVVLRL